jgi:predicted RNase H-like HicB family nuclease
MQTITLEVPEAQIIRWVGQLSPVAKRDVLKLLVPRLDETESLKKERPVKFTIETEQEVDGRWIAEVRELFGVLAYGRTRDDAIAKVEALGLRVLADRLESSDEARPSALQISFAPV